MTKSHDREYKNHSLRYLKWGTISSVILGVCSLVTATGALYVVYEQLQTMRIEQRAWLQVIVDKDIAIIEDKPLTAKLTVENIGKTPAKQILANLWVQIVEKRASFAMTPAYYRDLIGLLNPDGPISITVPMLREGFDILNPPLLTKMDVARLNSGETYIAVFGKLTYLDIYGTSHWVNFCGWGGPKHGYYTAGKCAEFNSVDNS